MSSHDWKNRLGAEQSGAPVLKPHGEIRKGCFATQIEPGCNRVRARAAIGCTRRLSHVES